MISELLFPKRVHRTESIRECKRCPDQGENRVNGTRNGGEKGERTTYLCQGERELGLQVRERARISLLKEERRVSEGVIELPSIRAHYFSPSLSSLYKHCTLFSNPRTLGFSCQLTTAGFMFKEHGLSPSSRSRVAIFLCSSWA